MTPSMEAMDSLFEGTEVSDAVQTDGAAATTQDGEQTASQEQQPEADAAGKQEGADQAVADQGEQAPAAAEPAAAEPVGEESLPEGVTVKEGKSGKLWVYPEERGRQVYAGYQASQRIADIIGEPPTEAAVAARQEGFQHFEDLRAEVLSGQPSLQRNVVENLLSWSQSSLKAGEIAADPMPGLLDQMFTVMTRSHPAVMDAVADRFLRSFINHAQQEAQKSGNENLLKSVRNIERMAFGAPVQEKDPSDPARLELERREQALQQREQRERHEAQETWKSSVAERNMEAVNEAIGEALKEYAEAYKDFPEAWKNILIRLNHEVGQRMKDSSSWRRSNDTLFLRGTMAQTEGARRTIQEQITGRYKQMAGKVAGEVASRIVSDTSGTLASQRAAKINRLETAETRKPNGAGVPQRGTIPERTEREPGSIVEWQKQFDTLFS